MDGYLAYVKPATVLCELVADPADPRYAIMAKNRTRNWSQHLLVADDKMQR